MAGANELIAIELQLKGYDGVMRDMRLLDQMLNGFRGQKNRVTIESNLAEAKKDVIAYRSEVDKLKNELKETEKYIKGTKIKTEQWTELNNALKEAEGNLKNARQRVTELQYALRNLASSSFVQTFKRISSAVAHVGSAMQSAGNALTRLTNPFANFTKGIVMGAGYKALNKFTEGLQSGFSRADTMRKYTRLMKEYETANYTAEQSRKELDESVTGLPIALDDAISLAQRYTLSLGDMERGTKLAIATNNAFLASMATENQRYQGMLQMQDLLNGKDLNAREWMSLGASMGKAINEIGKEFGYTNENMGEFRQELYAGQIDTQKFLDALQKVGTGEGPLVKLARESMDTWEAFFSRIGTAASRMGYGVITALDEITAVATKGKFTSVNSLLDDQFIPAIDNMTQSITGWIKAHPTEIVDFFKSLKAINWGSIIKGVGEAFQDVAKLVKSFSDAFGGKDLSWIGRWMVKGNILGNMLTITGGLLKGSRHIWGGIGSLVVHGVKTARNVKKFGGLAGYFGQLLGGDDPEKAEKAMETVAKTTPKAQGAVSGLSKIFRGWGQIATMVGGTALVGWGTFKAFKSMFKDLKEIAEISKQIDWSVASADLIAMGGFITAFIAVGTKVGSALGVKGLIGGGIFAGLTAIFAGTFWADMAMIKRGFKAIFDATEYIGKTVKNLNKLASVKDVGSLKAKIKNVRTLFNQITDILQISRNNPVTGESTDGLKELDSKSANTIKNVASAVKSIKSSVDTLNELNSVKLNTDNLLNVFGRLQHGLNMLGIMLVNMPEVFQTGMANSWASGMKSTIGNFKGALEGLVGENGILAMIPQVVNRMEGLDSSGKLLQLPAKMKKLGQALTDIYTSLQGIGAGEYFASNIDHFRAGIKSLKFAIQHLQEISGMDVGDGVVSKIQGIIDNIRSAFDQAKIAEIQATIIAFATAIKVALAIFETLNGDIEIDITFKLSQNFYSSKDAVIREIKNAKKDIRAQKGDISFTIGVRVFFNVVSNLGSALAKISRERQALQEAATGNGNPEPSPSPGQSTGGLRTRSGILYRSKGGSIFKPRGTDKVPAMLTPGEYVHKKQAVDFFGTDFMRKVNNMDVRGAMQALLTKAGSATQVGRQSIVNNTVNNNQRITQNINTNNPNFAGVRMGRFVGAL